MNIIISNVIIYILLFVILGDINHVKFEFSENVGIDPRFKEISRAFATYRGVNTFANFFLFVDLSQSHAFRLTIFHLL